MAVRFYRRNCFNSPAKFFGKLIVESRQRRRTKLMIMTQAVNEFFLIEDMANFAIKNDDSQSVAKPLWVPVERHGNFHLALALGVGQTATGPLMQFYRDMSMSCELGLKH